MWLSRWKYEEIHTQLKDLRSRLSVVEMQAADHHIYNDDQLRHYFISYPLPPAATISQRDLIQKIIHHIGLELVAVRGAPARVELQKAKKTA